MASSNSNPHRLRASSALAALLFASFACHAFATGNTACPLGNAAFGTSYGVDGAIQDGDSTLLYDFGMGGPQSWSACHRACQEWPSPGGVLCRPRNNEAGQCAYWSWTAGAGCKLYGCSACRTFNSYSTPQVLSRLSGGQRHCSGGGPRWSKCVGGVKGDPHYTGGDSSNFEFSGVPGNNYCLVSDSGVHVNVFYDGRFDVWGNNTHKPLTWIRKVGIMWGNSNSNFNSDSHPESNSHTLELEARSGAEWRYLDGYMSRILVDGREVRLNAEGESVRFEGSNIEITWVAAKRRDGDDDVDVYQVTVGNTLRMIAKLRPEVPLLRTNEDGIVHFTLEFPVLHVSENVHGVLGQTYRPDHKDRLSKHEVEFNELLQTHVVKGENAEGFLDGKPEDYVTSGLLKNDCTIARYMQAEAFRKDEKIVLYRKMLR